MASSLPPGSTAAEGDDPRRHRGLARLSLLRPILRRFAKWRSRLQDRRDRRQLARTPASVRPRAVVASCWSFPMPYHAFVYREMLGLMAAGLELRMFHFALGDLACLHAAHRGLLPVRSQLQPTLEVGRANRRYWQRRAPARLRAVVERIAGATGRDHGAIGDEPLLLQACTFARMAEAFGARYLHSYFFYDQSFMAMVAAALLEVPRGITCYADHMLQDHPLKLVSLQLQTADLIVATSRRIRDELIGIGGPACADRILVKPNGVPAAGFPLLEHPDRTGPFELLSICRIEPKKGLRHLVDAVARLRHRGVEVVVHLVGAADPTAPGSVDCDRELQQRIEELGLGHAFVRHGFLTHEELMPLLAQAQAFVAPYVETASGDKDGVPTALLEAMASGLAVVATDAGSIQEAVAAGSEALLVPQRDPLALADAIARIAGDPGLRTRLAAAARARFLREFDAQVTEQLLGDRVRMLLDRR